MLSVIVCADCACLCVYAVGVGMGVLCIVLESYASSLMYKNDSLDISTRALLLLPLNFESQFKSYSGIDFVVAQNLVSGFEMLQVCYAIHYSSPITA